MDYIFQNRTNILVAPTAPDGSLIMAFHGSYGAPASFQNAIKLEDIYPNSYILYVSAEETKLWKAGSESNDVAYIHSLLLSVKADYDIIDLTKISLTGHSGGGAMCYKAAAYLDEFNFASITTLCAPYLATEEFDYTGPVYHFHMVNDKIVPIAGTENYPSLIDTMASLTKHFKSARFDVRASNNIENDNAHNLGIILAEYPTLLTEIKTTLGL